MGRLPHADGGQWSSNAATTPTAPHPWSAVDGTRASYTGRGQATIGVTLAAGLAAVQSWRVLVVIGLVGVLEVAVP